MKNTLILANIVLLCLGSAGCSKNAFDRDKAAAMLKPYIESQPVGHLTFIRPPDYSDSMAKAKRDGILGFDGSFSPKGLEYIKNSSDATKVEVRFVGAGTEAQIPLKTPLKRTLKSVTGIRDDGPNKKIVAYETSYTLPSQMTALSNYVYTGETDEKTFQLYDDGWRMVE